MNPPKMGLLGGGEAAASGWGQPSGNSSLSNWGSSPATNSSSGWNSSVSSTNHWGNNGHQTNGETVTEASSSHSSYPKPSWAQAVCTNRGPNQTQVPNYSNDRNCSSNSRSHLENSSDKNPTSEHDMRHHFNSRQPPNDVLVAENWGQAVINQDKSWDLPPSPHQQSSTSDNSEWKSASSAGTEIWENTVRQKVKGPSTQTSVSSNTTSPSAQSWNHTPTTHIGGTWGEEEDASIVWTGVPQANGSSSHGSSNSNASNGSQNGALNTWGNKMSAPDASDPSVNQAWKPDPGHSRDDQQVRNSQNKSWGPQSSWGDPSSQLELIPAPKLTASSSVSSTSSHPEAPERLGTVVWGGEKPVSKQQPIMDSIIRPVKDIPGSCGWEDDGSHFVPPVEKRPPLSAMGAVEQDRNRDDGTAVWGNPTRQPKVSRWKEEQELLLQQQSNAKMADVSANGNSSVPSQSPGDMSGPGMIRLPPNASIASKSSPNDVWIKSQQAPQASNRSPWADGMPISQANHLSPSSSANAGWGHGDGDKSRQFGSGGWGEPQGDSNWGSKPKNSNSWSDGQIDTSSWIGPKQKPLSKDMILASKQFRVLTETGFKKDDVENALRASNMNIEEAHAELRLWASRDNFSADGDVKAKALNSNTQPSLLTSGLSNPSLANVSNRSLSFSNQQHPQQPPNQTYLSVNQVTSALRGQPSRGSTQTTLPSEKQLLHLVQQIQLAVHSGHLNPQILNQPLAPPTIQMIYQLLQAIKQMQTLQGLVAQQSQAKGVGWNPSMQSQIHVQITQAKQRISNLQNQIAVQQALYMKQQPPYPGSGNIPSSPVGTHPSLDFMKGPDMNLASDFRDLSLKQDPQTNQSQSRLKTTWKLPSFEKDSDPSNEPFSRAPGSTATKTSSGISVLTRPDPTWSNDTSAVGGWSDGTSQLAANDVLKDDQISPFLSELVPEFEPGKPWKGNSQLKNFEDDPHVTPGSVMNRSPLSGNTMFNNWGSAKANTTESGVNDSLASSLLASSTWAYTPSASGANSFNAEKSGNSISSKTWSSFGENNDSLWSNSGSGVSGSGSATKPRGPPPPGLSEFRDELRRGQASDGSDPQVQNLMCLLNTWLANPDQQQE